MVTAMTDWDSTGVGEPAEELEFDDLDLLADLTHPVRGMIFRWLRTPHSAAELAARMDVPVTRLYHHLNRLEQSGLIRVVATRRVGAVTERRYQVVARFFRLSEDRFDDYDPRELAAAMGAMFDVAKLRLQREIELRTFGGGPRENEALLALQELTLEPAQAEQFVARLRQLIDEFAAHDGPDDGGPPRLAVFLVAHPMTP